MSDKEKLDSWLKENEEAFCNFCIYNDDCQKGMVCYGGVPIEPYCYSCDDPLNFIDTDAILDELEEDD